MAIDSWAVSAIDNLIRGASCDKADNALFCGRQNDTAYFYEGLFTTTLIDSQAFGYAEIQQATADEAGNTPTAWYNTELLVLYSGRLTSSIIDSQSTSAFDVDATGISFDGADTPWTGLATDYLRVFVGQFTSTEDTNRSLGNIAPNGIERVPFTDRMGPLSYDISVSDSISVGETVARFVSVPPLRELSVSDSIAVSETVVPSILALHEISVSDSISIAETVDEFTNTDIIFIATRDATLTPIFNFSGTVIEVFVNDESEGTFTSGVAKDIVVTGADVIRYASSKAWTGVTKVLFDGDFISGDISQFATFINLTDLDANATQLSGNLSVLSLLVDLVLLDLSYTYISADADCLNTQVLMTTCNVDDCELPEAEVDNLLASLVINEDAGGSGRDCLVRAD